MRGGNVPGADISEIAVSRRREGVPEGAPHFVVFEFIRIETQMSFDQDPLRDRMRQGVVLRHQVHTMVERDINQAYRLAKSIEHPWYRCQALSEVADHSDRSSSRAILQESFESAMKCHDQNRRVSVACWPLRIALKNSLRDLCSVFLDQCKEQINQDMDPISKWCAAPVVNTIKGDIDFLREFYETFMNATSKGHGWRIERIIKYMLGDTDIQKDGRYVFYLSRRQSAIAAWKMANAKRSCA